MVVQNIRKNEDLINQLNKKFTVCAFVDLMVA